MVARSDGIPLALPAAPAAILQASRIWENGEMRFAPNHLYIEEYVKCVNCGVLIYEKAAADKS